MPTSGLCKVCQKSVTSGKVCALCRMPVCNDHRSKIGGWGDAKTYYCKPPCHGQGSPTGYGGQQQQQQQPSSSPYPAYAGPGGGGWGHAGGASPENTHNPYRHPASFDGHQQALYPAQQQNPGYYQQQQQQQQYPQPQPPRSQSPVPFTSPTMSASGLGGGPAPAYGDNNSHYSGGSSGGGGDDAVARFGVGVGDPLPTVPAPHDGVITVAFSNGTPCTVPEDVSAIERAFAAAASSSSGSAVERIPRRGDTVQYLCAPSSGAGGTEVRRGTVVGAVSDSLVVLERRRAANGFSAVAACVPTAQIGTVTVLQLGKCRHCGCLIPLDEARLHVDRVHKTSAGASTRVDATNGVCVGNVDLLLALQPKRRLGEGAQGAVWLCDAPPNVFVEEDVRMPHYVRKDVKCQSEDEAVARYQQAVRLMQLKHTHVIRYLAVQRMATNEYVRVVMPYYPENDLQRTIAAARERLAEDWICSVVLQLATALAYLHSHSPPILHGDLKPENVMLFNRKNQVILMDFDTSVELSGAATATGSVGTMEWSAPEAVAGGRCSVNSDVWSLGLIAFVLAVLPEFPMLENERGEGLLLNSSEWVDDALRRRIGLEVERHHYSRGFVALIQDMLSRDPRKRPSAAIVAERLSEIMEAALLGGSGGGGGGAV